MRKIYDARCTQCATVSEVFGSPDEAFRCTSCGGEAKRIISPIRCQLEGFSGDFPGAAMRWEREHIAAGKKNG